MKLIKELKKIMISTNNKTLIKDKTVKVKSKSPMY